MSHLEKQGSSRPNIELVKENEDLKERIKSVIEHNTPEKEVLFDFYTTTDTDNKGPHYNVCVAYTWDKRDKIPLVLSQKKYEIKTLDNNRGRGSDSWNVTFNEDINRFLNGLLPQVKGEAEANHRFLVEWTFKEKETRDKDPKMKTSHFFGKDMWEVMDKINASNIGSKDPIFVQKIELIPES